ncbi:MAG: exodeoxyribonuclease VII large subunit [Thermoflexales bacterium]|nr:exodeoxyribonuclease VII large subunit [Thermoflexales bacterium]
MTTWQSMLPGLDEPLSISEATARIKTRLESDPALSDLRVAGEIGNFTRAASGHLYFTLKDAGAALRCVMWRTSAARLRSYAPRSGDAVVARGRIAVYERDGAYQLIVEALAPAGVGDLHAEFERLKAKLAAEGVFDADRKRPLPALPRVLGVVTSPTAAAFQDVLNVLGRRYPLLDVVLSPTLVQGTEAPAQIVRALRALDDWGQCDVLLVTRGGGSLEELWAFNDEGVARAIAACRTPVVSGVGHEIDFTLADFAADVRAPTPSAAAELIAPDGDALAQAVDGLAARSEQLLTTRVQRARADLEALRRALRALGPGAAVQRSRERLRMLSDRLTRAMVADLSLRAARLRGVSGRLAAMGPLATLGRGYAIVTRAEDGTLIRSVGQAGPGMPLRVRVADGAFTARAGDEK